MRVSASCDSAGQRARRRPELRASLEAVSAGMQCLESFAASASSSWIAGAGDVPLEMIRAPLPCTCCLVTRSLPAWPGSSLPSPMPTTRLSTRAFQLRNADASSISTARAAGGRSAIPAVLIFSFAGPSPWSTSRTAPSTVRAPIEFKRLLPAVHARAEPCRTNRMS